MDCDRRCVTSSWVTMGCYGYEVKQQFVFDWPYLEIVLSSLVHLGFSDVLYFLHTFLNLPFKSTIILCIIFSLSWFCCLFGDMITSTSWMLIVPYVYRTGFSWYIRSICEFKLCPSPDTQCFLNAAKSSFCCYSVGRAFLITGPYNHMFLSPSHTSSARPWTQSAVSAVFIIFGDLGSGVPVVKGASRFRGSRKVGLALT